MTDYTSEPLPERISRPQPTHPKVHVIETHEIATFQDRVDAFLRSLHLEALDKKMNVEYDTNYFVNQQTNKAGSTINTYTVFVEYRFV